MASSPFQPSTPFGVPLTAIPHDLSWVTVEDMLVDVLGELRHEIVREHLLDVVPGVDAEIISNPAPLNGTIPASGKFRFPFDMNEGFEASVFVNRLYWPSFQRGNLGFGLAVSYSHGGKSLCSRHQACSRFVTNFSTSSRLNIGCPDNAGMVDCVSHRRLPSGKWIYAVLRFSKDLFLTAFQDGVNIAVAHAALMQSIAGGVHDKRPYQPIGNNHKYMAADNYGSHPFSGIYTTYLDTKPVMTFRLFAEGHWSFDISSGLKNEIRRWGVGDRLRKLGIGPLVMPEIKTSDQADTPPPSKIAQERGAKLIDTIIQCSFEIEDSTPHRTIQSESSSQQHVIDSSSQISQGHSEKPIDPIAKCPIGAEDALPKPLPVPSQLARQYVTGTAGVPAYAAAEQPNASARSNQQYRSIAPAPLLEVQRPPTAEEMQEQERQDRIERRKIRMRAAAQRYNEKKSRERRERRLNMDASN